MSVACKPRAPWAAKRDSYVHKAQGRALLCERVFAPKTSLQMPDMPRWLLEITWSKLMHVD